MAENPACCSRYFPQILQKKSVLNHLVHIVRGGAKRKRTVCRLLVPRAEFLVVNGGSTSLETNSSEVTRLLK